MRNQVADYLFNLANWISTEKKVLTKKRERLEFCRSGKHPLSDDSVYTSVAPNGRIKRSCRECLLERSRTKRHNREPKPVPSYIKGSFKFERIDK